MSEPQSPRREERASGLGESVAREAADLATEAAGGGLRLLFGVVAIAAGVATFFAVGASLDVWRPAVGLVGLGLVSWIGFAIWKLRRYALATGAAFFGAAISAVASDGPGLTVAAFAAAAAGVALFWSIAETWLE